MTFLAPWMLAGLAAASAPVILHFFYRSRYRTVPWAAMKFLLTSVEQTSRRLRFQELLLLATRTVLLLLLALALARPSSSGQRGASDSDAVDAVFVFDTSFSMGAREGNSTRLERAKESALGIINHLPPHSTVQVIACSDREQFLGPVSATNLDLARETVKSVELSALASDLLPGAKLAHEKVKGGLSPNKEVYLFTDHQKRAWDAQAAALTAAMKELGKDAAVYLVRSGTRTPRNVSITGVSPQTGIPHTGERLGFAVLLRNTGNETVQNLTVSLEVEGRGREKETQSVAALAPGETTAVTLTAKLDKPGLRLVTAAVASDELEADNRFTQVLNVREQVRALVVDGAPSDLKPENAATFYLMHSLRPVPESVWGGYHLQPRAVLPGDASPALLADKDLCILVNAPVQATGENSPGALPGDFIDRLGGFVKEGKGLLIFGGPRVSAELYNRVLFDEQKILPIRMAAAEKGAVHPDPGSADAAGFLAPFREEPLSRLDQANVAEWHGVEERTPAEYQVPLRFGNGKAAVVERKAGAGRVILVTTSADLRWTDWPLRHTYLPFVHLALSRLLGGQAEVHNGTSGEAFRWRPPAADSAKVFAAIDPAGRRSRLGAPAVVDGQPVLTLDRTLRAGAYRVFADAPGAPKEADEGVVFAAVPDLRESEDLEALTDKQIDERLGFVVRHLTAGEETGAQAGAERLRREWTLWILSIVLLLVLFEAALAWYCGRGW